MSHDQNYVDFLDNTPNAAKLIESLRESGYENVVAIADLVDNSIDAEASKVKIHIIPESGTLTSKDTRIIIVDDGVGMSNVLLNEALKLGSDHDIDRDYASDLGKYGMGLITASISMSMRLTVLTKQSDDNLQVGIHDLNEIIKTKKFVKVIREASKEDINLWQKYAINKIQGTIVVLDLCDRITYTRAGAFINALRNHLGQTFRYYISAKSKLNGSFFSFIEINEEPVYIKDPLMLKENSRYFDIDDRIALSPYSDILEDTVESILLDREKPVLGSEGIRIRIVQLPVVSQGIATKHGINPRNQGLYILRNNREIATGILLPKITRHPSLNYFRAEVHLPAAIDKRCGINWMKRNINFDQDISDKLYKIIGPHTASIKKSKEKKESRESKVNHEPYEKIISSKSKLLIKPPVKKEEREQKEKTGNTVLPKNTSTTRSGEGSNKIDYKGLCEFKEISATALGPLWTHETIGRKIIIKFNIDHPFWYKFIIEGGDSQGKKNIQDMIHFIAYCFTTAELKAFGEDEYEKMETLSSVLSSNMRILLS